MSIMNIEWTCKKCDAKFNLDKPLKLQCEKSLEQINKTIEAYIQQNKTYSAGAYLRVKKRDKFRKLIAENNKKFWRNKWSLLESNSRMYIYITGNTWWKKGKSGEEHIKNFDYPCSEPNEFKDVHYGIICPMCQEMLIIKVVRLRLSDEV